MPEEISLSLLTYTNQPPFKLCTGSVNAAFKTKLETAIRENRAGQSGYNVSIPEMFYSKDELFQVIAAGFGPYAMMQWNSDGSVKGFNVQLHYYDD